MDVSTVSHPHSFIKEKINGMRQKDPSTMELYSRWLIDWPNVIFLVSLTRCRDPADNAPAPPNRSAPSNCANLQAPRDTWVQLRTASLVEPPFHVSPGAPHPNPPYIHSFVCSWTTVVPHICCPCILPRTEAVLNPSPMCTSALLSHQIWSPPSYATAQFLHGLPMVTTGTRHLSAKQS